MVPKDYDFGRRRVKKTRPIIPSAGEQSADMSPHEPPPGPVFPAVETQASLNIPMPEIPSMPAEPAIEAVSPPGSPAPGPKAEPLPERKPEKPQAEQLRVEQPIVDRPRPERPRQRPERRSDPREHRDQRRDGRDRPRERPPDRSPERPQQRQSTDRRRIRVSVIIPAFNEEDNIKPLLDQFQEIVSRVGNDWEVILVDDGSNDKTAEKARDAAIRYHWLRVVSYKKNRGLTAALETGFQSARGSVFVFYPADLQYHPQDIPRMINRIDRGADLVTGWKQGRYQKRFVSYVYNKLCQTLFKVKVHDLNSVKTFKKEVIDRISMRRDWHRYMVVLAAESGFNIDEVKVNVYPRHAGKSKFGTGRILGGVLDLLAVKFQVSFTRKPLRFFGTLGVLSILAGFITGLLALYLRFFTPHGSRVWLYLVILFVLSGLMLFSLGFLAEVIVSIRDEIESLKGKK